MDIRFIIGIWGEFMDIGMLRTWSKFSVVNMSPAGDLVTSTWAWWSVCLRQS